MEERHLRLPVQFSGFLSGAEMPRCRQTGESVGQHLQMLLTTKPGENRFDTEYGCSIWDLDFELIMSEGTWKEQFRLAVIHSVTTYEPRIEGVKVDIELTAIERFGRGGEPNIKRRAQVLIRAKMKDTGEPFSFKTELMLSPLSVE